MFDQQKIIQTIRIKGPVIPSNIAKVIGTDILMASAVLSELLSSKKIKISKLKVGGSPVYYLPGQEAKLQNFKDYLNEKNKRTVDLLKEKKIIRDRNAEPLTRVSLRQINDFAVPLQVTVNGQKEIFWKWYLISNNEAEELLKSTLNPPKPEQKKQDSIQEKSIRQNIPDVQAEKSSTLNKNPEKNIVHPEYKPIEKKEVQDTLSQSKQETKTDVKKLNPLKQTVKKIFSRNTDDFFDRLKSKFSRMRIHIVNEISKKKNEAEFIIDFDSSIGNLRYYCRAKNKKRITDSDLDALFAQGQLLKLPVLLMSSGELNKKAQAKLKEYKSIIIKKV